MEAHLRYMKQLSSNGVKSKIKDPSLEAARKPAHVKVQQKEEDPPVPPPPVEERPPPRIDFIQRNIDNASATKSRAKVPKPEAKTLRETHSIGEIPNYIAKRKEEIVFENAPPPEAKCPKGMRVLSEEEKQDALQGLIDRKKEIESTLSKAPLRIESPTLIRQKRMLEAELAELEKSMAMLHRKYIFVPEGEGSK